MLKADISILHPHPESSVSRNELGNEFEVWNHLTIPHSHILGELPQGSTVVPRLRALPFGRELEDEVKLHGSCLINSYQQHRFAADIGEWYLAFGKHTPLSWRRAEDIPIDETGPFIVKGETNSKRQLWATHCYAESKAELGTTISNLMRDSLIGYQNIWIRKFVPLNVLTYDIVGMPISEEYRVFYYNGIPVASGFYWINHLDDIDFHPDINRVSSQLREYVGQILYKKINFVAVDFAITAEGESIVIEINDGSMAGICGVNPSELWEGVIRLA